MNSSVLGAGTMILVPDPRDIDDILKTIHKHRPTYYPGVPAMYVAINNHPDAVKYDLGSIKACSSGAAPLPVEVQGRFQDLTGARLVEGYGLSEASPVTHGNTAFGECRIGTIGVPWPDTEAKIVDAEIGENVLGVGEVGELCVRGPQVMKSSHSVAKTWRRNKSPDSSSFAKNSPRPWWARSRAVRWRRRNQHKVSHQRIKVVSLTFVLWP